MYKDIYLLFKILRLDRFNYNQKLNLSKFLFNYFNYYLTKKLINRKKFYSNFLQFINFKLYLDYFNLKMLISKYKLKNKYV